MKPTLSDLAKLAQSKASESEYYGTHEECVTIACVLAALASVVQRLAEEQEEYERRLKTLEKDLNE